MGHVSLCTDRQSIKTPFQNDYTAIWSVRLNVAKASQETSLKVKPYVARFEHTTQKDPKGCLYTKTTFR